jgi:hypothetical protein
MVSFAGINKLYSGSEMKSLIAIFILTSSISFNAMAATKQKSQPAKEKLSRKIASSSDFKPIACGKSIKLGRPTVGDALISNVGACYGSIPTEKGLDFVFVSYRNDGFIKVFQPMPSEEGVNSKETKFLDVGYLNKDGKFEAAKYKDISIGRLEVNSSDVPLRLFIKDGLGHKQKDIRINYFDENVSPSDFM